MGLFEQSNVISKLSIQWAAALCLLGLASQVEAGRGNVSKVLGGIHIDTGEQAGDLSSVNGGIELDDQSTAQDVETVNGSIRIGHQVKLRSAATVNGRIVGRSGLQVDKSLETVNGGITIGEGSSIGKHVETVNGDIEVEAASISGDVLTTNGSVELNSTRVDGDIVFRKNKGWFNSDDDRRKPKLIIDSRSSVAGTIHLYREVVLEIDPNAKVGEVVRHYLK